MPDCELCGKKNSNTRAMIEGVEMTVCNSCASLGKVLKPPKKFIVKKRPGFTAEEESKEIIVTNYPSIIRGVRQKLGLRQKEFAKMLAERESLIQALESGKTEPSIKLARKLEKKLKVKLIEEYKEQKMPKRKKSSMLIIGDIVKIRKR
ncbi:TIGR00270 family protein [Candidatus Woesearchaeota archaeon]|nr:MAG: TIGR00270 family protein [Candidatus Woesearchaeota archaeon]